MLKNKIEINDIKYHLNNNYNNQIKRQNISINIHSDNYKHLKITNINIDIKKKHMWRNTRDIHIKGMELINTLHINNIKITKNTKRNQNILQ